MTNDETIKNDLLTMEAYDFYLKHIVKSHNWYFTNYLCVPQDEIIDKMDFFKEIVSGHADIFLDRYAYTPSIRDCESFSVN